MKTTEFGKFLRKLRIDNNELLKDMANKLGIAPSYLSAVEIGKRNIPKKWESIIIDIYNLDECKSLELKESIVISAKTININIEHLNTNDKKIIFKLVENINKLNITENNLNEILYKNIK